MSDRGQWKPKGVPLPFVVLNETAEAICKSTAGRGRGVAAFAGL